MQTLTINLPGSLDPEQVRWELARSLYEKGELTMEEAAKLVDLTPTYFKLKLAGLVTGIIPNGTFPDDKPTDLTKIEQIASEMNIQESWKDLVTQIGR